MVVFTEPFARAKSVTPGSIVVVESNATLPVAVPVAGGVGVTLTCTVTGVPWTIDDVGLSDKVVALEDRCVHRAAALSLGEAERESLLLASVLHDLGIRGRFGLRFERVQPLHGARCKVKLDPVDPVLLNLVGGLTIRLAICSN